MILSALLAVVLFVGRPEGEAIMHQEQIGVYDRL